MAQFRVATTTVEGKLRTLGNTSQMKNIMTALLAIDGTNGKDADSEAWKKVKESFEDFGFTAVYDRNLVLLLCGLFVAISRSRYQDLKTTMSQILSIQESSTLGLGFGGSRIFLSQAVQSGDGKCIKKILEKDGNFRYILKMIGINDKYINRCIARMGKITPWKRDHSKTAARAVSDILWKLSGQAENKSFDFEFDEFLIEKEKQFRELSKWKNVVTRVTISDKIKNIPKEAFKDFKKLKAVTILGNINDIGEEAFSGCSNLESVTIPGKVHWICKGCFKNCAKLEEISIPEGTLGIGDEAFCGCTSLTGITLPDSLQRIGNNAFQGCTSLEKIIFPKNVTYVGIGSFNGCDNLCNITIKSRFVIFPDTFNRCAKGKSLVINADDFEDIAEEIKQQVQNG